MYFILLFMRPLSVGVYTHDVFYVYVVCTSNNYACILVQVIVLGRIEGKKIMRKNTENGQIVSRLFSMDGYYIFRWVTYYISQNVMNVLKRTLRPHLLSLSV